MNNPVLIESTDFWVKIVAMLEQNWALIKLEEPGTVRIYFISDSSGVFDEIGFRTEFAALQALRRNGFERFAANSDLQSFLHPPPAPYSRSNHPNGPIYSSGRFWRS